MAHIICTGWSGKNIVGVQEPELRLGQPQASTACGVANSDIVGAGEQFARCRVQTPLLDSSEESAPIDP
jgi:hypothetical protein